MGRKKKQSAEASGDLLSQPIRQEASAERVDKVDAVDTMDRVLVYTPLAETEKWQVEKVQLFVAEFGFDAKALPDQAMHFHEVGMQHTRGWLICRRLFGIGPVIPPADAHPDDLQPKSRAEICAALGLQPDELQAELDAMRGLWRNYLESQVRASKADSPLTPALSPLRGEGDSREPDLKFGDELLREFGFEEGMFEVIIYNPVTKQEEPRKQEVNRVERDWFCKRLKDWEKMLREPMASTLAREALLNDLYLRRFEMEMTRLGQSSPKWKQLYDLKKQIETIYQEQLTKLEEAFPEMQIAGKQSFRGVISDLNKMHRDYYGRGDRRLMDKVNTAAEIEVLLRQSVQRPEPQYRFGLNIAIVEAMHGLYDPNWRPQFKHSTLKKLDAGFKEAVMRMREALAEPLVDLEKGVLPGEGDDYPDLKGPPEDQPRMDTDVHG
jgi:hypothetical protein